MGTYKNLSNREAVKKIQEIADGANICLFTTSLNKVPLATCPMATQEIDEEGNIWFMSMATSEKNQHIIQDNRVQLFYANHSAAEYLSIYGEAEITKDPALIDKYWSAIAKTWFPKGKEDPEITIIKVSPLDAYYWDTKHNKMVALIKMLAGAVVGQTDDDGIQGHMELGNNNKTGMENNQ